ncbi:TPA: restriction endonuclease subunit S [Legionella pneumophila]|nr:restriction endonuclease subunit S [Legionella pneumophila]
MSKVSLSKRIALEYGFAVRVDNEPAGPYPIYGSNGATGYIGTYKVAGPGVIIGRKGTVGKVTFSEENFTPTDTAYYLKLLDPELDDIKFWSYFLPKLGLEKLNTHSAVPGLSREIVYLLEVNIPERSSQLKITEVLSALDKKIEINNKINFELESMAKTLFDYWFVQFDFPDANGKPYKSSGGKMVYDKILSSEIPQGWRCQHLVNLTSLIQRGISPKYVDDGGVLVLNQKCIRDQKVSFNDARRHGGRLEKNDKRLLNITDILVNSTGVGTLGRVAFIKRLPEREITVDSHVTIVRANQELISPEYLAWSIMRLQPLIESAANGSTGQVELSKPFLEELKIVVPDIKIQRKFQSYLNPIIKKLANCEKESEKLTKLRDWLLPMLMNGQVSVKVK